VNNGGAAMDLVRTQGDFLASLVGPEFDILGFDPRGTGATTPLALCFDSDSQLAVWNLQDVRSLNVSDNSIPFARAYDNVVGMRCLRALGGNGSNNLNATAEEWGPGRYMDTASVATDMLRIAEKLGQEKVQYLGSVSVDSSKS
jgi:pimeloyl-ACP methyl ester carboxylesterase